MIDSGVLPIMSLASKPIAKILLSCSETATTEGSFKIIPLPGKSTKVLAVPKSIPNFFIKKLGIDLGTANTLVLLPGKGIILNEPSVVAVSEQDNKILAIGFEAKNMIGKTPESIIVYCPMKDGVIADYRVTEAMLYYFINKAMGQFNFLKPDVMVSVPAGITSTERRAVIEATIRAGAKNAYVVKEPILAAIGAGIPIYESKGH